MKLTRGELINSVGSAFGTAQLALPPLRAGTTLLRTLAKAWIEVTIPRVLLDPAVRSDLA